MGSHLSLTAQTSLYHAGPELKQSDRQVLELISKLGNPTRAQLTHATELTQPSISRIVSELAQRGLVDIGLPVPAGRGQPSASVALRPTAAYSVGASVTPDGVTLVAVDLCGAVFASIAKQAPEPSVDLVCEEIKHFLRCASKGSNRGELAGVGLGITGYFVKEDQVVNPPGLDDWAMRPLLDELKTKLDMPVWLENDGTAAAIGENLAGAGRDAKHFAYFYFGVGFGGGLVCNGSLMRGAKGNAGEFGAMSAASKSLLGLVSLKNSVESAGGPKMPSLADFLAAMDPEWPGVSAWLMDAGAILAVLATDVQAAVDPNVIVLGGRLPPVLLRPLLTEIALHQARRNLPLRRGHSTSPETRIVAGTLNHDPAAFGAAAIPLRSRFFDSHTSRMVTS